MKKVALMAVCVAAIFSFVACSKKTNDGKITLTVWESTNGPDEFIRQAGEIYTQSHPNVTIKYVNVELGDAVGQIALDGPAGKGADVFAAPNDRLSSLVTGGHVLATSNPDEVKTHALASCVKALTSNGVMYGYPVSAETYALFYNKALIKENEVPKTWLDLAEWAKKFNVTHPDKYGFVMNVGEGYYTIIFTTGEGNRLFGENGDDHEHSNINSEKSIKGMKFFQALRGALNVPASDLDTASVDGAFQGGRAAMHITGLWNVVPFTNAGIDFGVAPIPALMGDSKPAASFSGTRAMFVSAYTDHPTEANDFARFLMSDEMQKLRFKLTGALPSVNIEIDSPYVGGFLEQLKYAFPMPSIPEMGMYWEAMNNASKNIWDGADVKSELDACNASIVGK
ncbi:MAG: maltose ABC transporter substrate-binding protein [Treponema sp.]|nr:maltose ABC transporter substrate-binding protein [Treponema sp.]